MRKRRVRRLGIALAALMLLFLSPSADVEILASTPPPPAHSVAARIAFDTPGQLQALTRELDVWEVHRDEGYLMALIQPDQYVALATSGYQLQVDEQRLAYPNTIPDYPCYRTISELYADLQQVVAGHSDIAQLIDIGDSYEGRDIWVVRITRRAITGTKPVLFLMANIHGRELITPEAAMLFVDDLTDAYRVDPDVTWLVDYHEIHVLVSANPDGHVKNEPGEPWAWWRKNTHAYGSCSPDDYGVDLNRNHSFKWGCCGGSSGNPCAETYRGPHAASEPETQAVQAYVRSLFPDQRGPDNSDPAPADATGVLLTLHSYSNLVLWPWGWTSTPAPNSDGLNALGRKMATYNGYTPQQSNSFYPTDGTTDDWAYGELGIASYTFEIGSSGDGFYPPCSRYEALIQPNIPAFLYAAKVARTPYMTSHGPDARSVVVTPDHALGGRPVQLTASINDDDNGEDVILGAEYYVDTPPWAGGTAVAMRAADGGFDASVEEVEASVPSWGWSAGRHVLFVRGQDALGNWGPPSAVFVDAGDVGELQLGKTGPAYPVRPSDWLTYTLTLTNNSAISLTDLVVTDTLPHELSFISASPAATFDGRQVRWSGLAMVPESSLVLSLVAQVKDGVPAGTVIRNADYGARANQMPTAATGTLAVETPVGELYGVALFPAAAQRDGLIGASVAHALQVTNTGNTTDTFGVNLSGYTWPAARHPTVIPLGLGARASLIVTVDIPARAAAGDTDTLTVTVASQGDPSQRVSAVLTTEAIPTHHTYLPVISGWRSVP